MVPNGYVAALQCDPVEKKPFFHFLPGSKALTFGMLGCDFHCPYCQNWDISQSLRDSKATVDYKETTPEKISQTAKKLGAGLVVSSYNEPLITAEWAVSVFKEVRNQGFKTAFVSNGNATPEVLEFLKPHCDAYKVDLKSMRQENYREMGGKLSTVLESIAMLKERGFWLEIVTLIIEGFNDSKQELTETAKFIANVSKDIPWHVTAFHKDYKMTDPDNTSVKTLKTACEIGKEAGLNYIYAGNIPGNVGNYENTYCPSCNYLLIERIGYKIIKNEISAQGACPSCKTLIPGIWN